MDLARFLRMAEAQTPAVVLFSGNPTGIGLLRSLGRRGIPLWALDPNPDAVVLRSRYAHATVCSDTHHDEQAFLADLIDIGRMLPRKALLIPSHDDYVEVLCRSADDLAEWFILQQPPPATMQALSDKEQQFLAAWRAGVDTPKTAFIHDEGDLAGCIEQVPLPAVIKPAVPQAFRRRTGAKVIRVNSPAEVREAFERAHEYGTLLLQEFVPGSDDRLYNYGSYLNAQSQPLAQFTRLKIRQHPRTFGEIRFGESIWVQAVADAGLRLLQELRYHGISGVEFKRDPRDGRYKLMEINARSTIISHTLAPYVGVDIPYVAYRDAIGSPIVAPRQRDGVRWIQCSFDLPDSVLEIARGQMKPLDWVRSLKGTRVDGILALDDPVPGIIDLQRAFVRPLRRKIRASFDGRGATRVS
jgi:predicted ATP-grasp superfamily ATP-dependent carboligase